MSGCRGRHPAPPTHPRAGEPPAPRGPPRIRPRCRKSGKSARRNTTRAARPTIAFSGRPVPVVPNEKWLSTIHQRHLERGEGKAEAKRRGVTDDDLTYAKGKEDELLDVCKSARAGHRRNSAERSKATELGLVGFRRLLKESAASTS